jgi:flavin reductase (DIM6/NTAB) family NADH-FMN oxidoreductase RutF
MISFDKEAIENLTYVKKINLVNSVTGYKSANLIGTKSKTGVTNVAVFSSVTHFGSSPAILGFVLRPTTVIRNTYENIKETGVFTINPIFKSNIKDAHHTSAKYPKDVSEFDKTSLEEEYKDKWEAPFVKKAPIQLAMEYLEEYEIKANGTILVLAEIKKIYVREELLEDDYLINLTKGEIAAINGLDTYAVPTNNLRLSYQRPKESRSDE